MRGGSAAERRILVDVATVKELRSHVMEDNGKVIPGTTTVDNVVLAEILLHVNDCRQCPVLAEGIREQLEKAQELADHLQTVRVIPVKL